MEASPIHFVEEIDFCELQTQEVVGRGAFGVVSRALWRGIQVAVKLIETESERKAFITELKQLSRVNHPNIVKLYGACTTVPVCLVMEYAEGGSLYNVLHKEGPQVQFNSGHAMSWLLQCAKGIAYLHGMKPKPLIHRDLKPPNLLLVAGGHTLKICDFGTACDAHTHMTNNKGSAAWMAPEVFEGCNYSEKCDVFSFGIIIWEVLTRRKPFENLGGPAFRIMWAVHSGTRPPLIKDCPKPIDELMRRCWAANPVERPPIHEVVRLLTHLSPYFPGADEPLTYPQRDEVEGETASGLSSIYDTPPLSNQSSRGTTAVNTQIVSDTVMPGTPQVRPVAVEEVFPRGTSAPPSLAASHENLLDKTNSRSSTPSTDINNKRFSADLTKLEEKDILAAGMVAGQAKHVKTHRRTGSHGTAFVPPSTDPRTPPSGEGRGHRRTGSFGDSSVTQSAQDLSHVAHPCMGTAIQPPITDRSLPHLDLNNLHRSVSWSPNVARNATPSPAVTESDPVVLRELFHGSLDVSMQPLPPCNTSPESVAIYVEHMNLIHKYVQLQAEIALLTQTKHDMTKELETSEQEQQDSTTDLLALQRLNTENDNLEKWYENLKKQVQECRDKQHRRPTPPAAS